MSAAPSLRRRWYALVATLTAVAVGIAAIANAPGIAYVAILVAAACISPIGPRLLSTRRP